jgi:hypothetical protein
MHNLGEDNGGMLTNESIHALRLQRPYLFFMADRINSPWTVGVDRCPCEGQGVMEGVAGDVSCSLASLRKGSAQSLLNLSKRRRGSM